MANNSTTSDDEKSVHQQRTSADDGLCGDLRFRKPKETEATEQASPSEPVETRLAADGGYTSLTTDQVIAMVVTRFPAGVDNWMRVADLLVAEVRRLREERDLFAEAGRAAELRIVELREQVTLMGASLKQQDEEMKQLRAKVQLDGDVHVVLAEQVHALEAKLARVEALPARWRDIQPPFGGTEAYAKRCVFEQLTTELEAALRDEPQPEREPKLPYNGY